MPTILTLVPNLLFGASITHAVQAAGATVRPCRTADTFIAALQSPADLVGAVVDLGGNATVWERAIRAATSAGVAVFAFGPHLDGATLKGARQAGAARVVANSALAQEFPKWLEQRLTMPAALEDVAPDDDSAA